MSDKHETARNRCRCFRHKPTQYNYKFHAHRFWRSWLRTRKFFCTSRSHNHSKRFVNCSADDGGWISSSNHTLRASIICCIRRTHVTLTTLSKSGSVLIWFYSRGSTAGHFLKGQTQLLQNLHRISSPVFSTSGTSAASRYRCSTFFWYIHQWELLLTFLYCGLGFAYLPQAISHHHCLEPDQLDAWYSVSVATELPKIVHSILYFGHLRLKLLNCSSCLQSEDINKLEKKKRHKLTFLENGNINWD